MGEVKVQAVMGLSVKQVVDEVHPTPYTLHPTPYTLQPTPNTLHLTSYTLHPTPYTLHPTPHTLHFTPHTLHPCCHGALGQASGGRGAQSPPYSQNKCFKKPLA